MRSGTPILFWFGWNEPGKGHRRFPSSRRTSKTPRHATKPSKKDALIIAAHPNTAPHLLTRTSRAYLANLRELGLVSRRTEELHREAVEERLVVVWVNASRPHVLKNSRSVDARETLRISTEATAAVRRRAPERRNTATV